MTDQTLFPNGEYERHPLNTIIPEPSRKRVNARAADIKVNGQRDRVILYEGKILNGWLEYLACGIAKVTPTFEVLSDDCPPIDCVVSDVVNRQHFTIGERALMAAKFLVAVLREGAWSRMLAGKADPSLPGGQGGRSAARAATLFDVGRATVERALKVLEKGPPLLIALVESGDLKVGGAAGAAKLCDLPTEKLDKFLSHGKEGRAAFLRKMEVDAKVQKMRDDGDDDRQQDFGNSAGAAIIRRDGLDRWTDGGGAIKEERRAKVIWDIPECDLDLASTVFKRINEDYGWPYRFLFDVFYHRTTASDAPALTSGSALPATGS